MIGEIRLFSGNFAPKNWAFCNGQVLPIFQNELLFLVIGAAYGGDGRTTFALPDLRGRVPIHAGSGSGLSTRKIGQSSGTETNSLTISQISTFNHPNKIGDKFNKPVNVEISKATSVDPNTDYYSAHDYNHRTYNHESETLVETNIKESIVETISPENNLPINNMPPFAVVNYIIALIGINPERW